MPNYRNKSKIVKREELIPPGKLEEGMVITFRYNTGTDKTPVVLVIYYDRKKKMIEGINLNYLVLSKVKKIFQLTKSRLQTEVQKDEKVIGVSQDFTRVPISAFRKRSQITPERYYKQVVKADPDFGKAYRSYKFDNITAAQVVDLKEDILK